MNLISGQGMQNCKRLTILALTLILLGASPKPADAATPPAAPARPPDSRTLQILDLLGKRFQDVQTAGGEFRQIKRSETFREESINTGEFWYAKPDRFRAEYKGRSNNEEMTTLVANNVLYVGIPRYKQLEIYPFDDPKATQRHLDRILIGFGIATDQILKNYDVSLLEEEKGQALLRFIPKFEDNYGLETLLIRLDLQSMRPVALELHEGEDKTTIQFRDFKLNPKIDKDRFEPRFPKEWEVIRRVE